MASPQSDRLIIDPGDALIQPKAAMRPKAVKWERDPALNDFIAYLDEPRFYAKKIKTTADRFDLLSVKEIETIAAIAKKCRDDFTYASRNFFWITTEKREDKLLQLKESQWLIYEHMLRLRGRGLPMKIMLIKARRLGASTLCEALIAWRTMFFRNAHAMVVSFDPAHAASLFAMMQHMYDLMPWWLKPMCSARKYEEGLIFDNPEYEERRTNPGLGSQVMVEAANKRSGVGVGVRISACHLSEFCLWDQNDARRLIEMEIGPALSENDPTMFAILESTARGTGNYSHTLWKKNVQLGDQAEWHPVFLPWFFESTRFLPPIGGWRPEPEDTAMRERIEMDWTRCDHPDCLQYHERYRRTLDMDGETCPTCQTGTLHPYTLTDGQLVWMQRKRKNASKDEESKKALLQELAATSESAFQASGTSVFHASAQEFAASTARPPLKEGFFDKAGKVHGCNPYNRRRNPTTNQIYDACYTEGCNVDHSYGNTRGETPLKIWVEPEDGQEYVIGADVSEGYGGDSDYSAACVFRIDKYGGADEQVAVWRSNTTSTINFAAELNILGRWYKDALLAVENNVFDTTVNELKVRYGYPRLYRMKSDAVAANLAGKMGWRTQSNSKPRLYQTWNQRLGERLIIVRSETCVEEMKTFVKEHQDGVKTGAAKGNTDDLLMASMVAFYCAHENDWDENMGQLNFKRELTMEEAPWHWACMGCQLVWPSLSKDEKQCQRCKCMVIQGKANIDLSAAGKQGDPWRIDGIPADEVKDWSVPTWGQSEDAPSVRYEDL